MKWRETFVLWFGPGIFGGVTFGDCLALLRENRVAVDPQYWLRAAIITLGSLSNSLIRWREEAAFGQTFVHIHRDPYVVFQSARHTVIQIRRLFGLQRSKCDIDDQIIRYYQEATDAFFDEKALIPTNRFHEIRFDDLQRDPVGQMRNIYEALALPDFGQVEPAMTNYLASLSGYEKNTYAPLASELRARIAHEWRKSFEAWGYPP